MCSNVVPCILKNKEVDNIIKVLHIISTPGLGGAQILLRNLIANSKNQHIYCLRKDDNDIFEGMDKVIYYNSHNYYKFHPLILVDLIRVIKKYKFELLDLHLGKPLTYAYIIKIFNPNINIVFHEHGKIFNKKNNRIYSIYLHLLEPKINMFIAVSNTTKKKLMENAGIPENKIKVIDNCVDLKTFNPENVKKNDMTKQREKLGIEKKDFVVGFVGRLNKVKGCEYLIKSIPYLNIPNLKILIAGDGIEKKKLENLAEILSVEENIIFVGYVKNILHVYGIIDVLVVPSEFESFGLSVIEAQACGIPVIVSNVGALNELIKNNINGLMFEYGNNKQLIEKIKLIHDDEKLRDKIIKNELEYVKKYSLDAYLEQLDKIYNNLS